MNGDDDFLIDANSISGDVTLVEAAATVDILLNSDGSYENLTLTAGDFDEVVLSAGVDATVDSTFFLGAVDAVDGTAGGADETMTINMTGTTLNLGGVTVGATEDVDFTVTGTTGNDTITFFDAKSTGSTVEVTGNGGSDTFRLENLSGNAADGVIVADAISINDFNAGNDFVTVAVADIVGGGAVGTSVASKATGAVDLDSDGFVFINNASSTDFTSIAQLSAAVGNITNYDTTDSFFVAVKNVDGSEVAIYNVVLALGAAEVTIDAGDTVTLVGVVDVTAGTFGIGNIGVH